MTIIVLSGILIAIAMATDCYLLDLVETAYEKYERIRAENFDFDAVAHPAEECPIIYIRAYMSRHLSSYPDPRNPVWEDSEESYESWLRAQQFSIR